MKTVKFILPIVAFFIAVAVALANVMPSTQESTQGYAQQAYDATGTLRDIVNISSGQSCTTTTNANPVCLVYVPGIGNTEAYGQWDTSVTPPRATGLLYRTPN
jgi:uncharacterized membrane protein YdfJ with MMPL/SSD domain